MQGFPVIATKKFCFILKNRKRFIFPFFFSIFAPNVSSILYIIWVSCMCGTLYSVVFPAFNIVAAIIGSDEFFEPDIFTEPSNFWPPSIM